MAQRLTDRDRTRLHRVLTKSLKRDFPDLAPDQLEGAVMLVGAKLVVELVTPDNIRAFTKFCERSAHLPHLPDTFKPQGQA